MGDDRDPVEERWETVAAFTSPIEARIALGALEAAGIDAELKDEATIGVAWHLSNALGGVRLQVRASQLDAARGVLAEQAPPDEHADAAARTGAHSAEGSEAVRSEHIVVASVSNDSYISNMRSRP
jgi:hypothetical protein